MSRWGKVLWFVAGMSLVSFAVVRFLLGGWVPFLWVALGLSAVSVVGAFLVDRSFYGEFFSLRTTKKGMNMGTMILLVLVLLSAINVLSARHYKTWDFSIGRINTLSDQSIKLAESLKDDLKVIYFYQDGAEGVVQNKRMFIDLVRRYQDVNPKIKLEFVEVNERPDLAKKYDITRGTQTVVLEYQGRKNTIEKIDEQEFTGALAKVTREREKKVIVLSGHGEVGLEPAKDGRSLSVFKSLLEGNRYKVESFSFTQAAVIPSDTDVLVIWGPRQQFLDFEIKAVMDYLKNGGSLLLAVETGHRANTEELLKPLGLQAQDNVVVTVLETPFGRAVDPRVTRGTDFSTNSSITKPFGKGEVTLFRMPQSLIKSPAASGDSFKDFTWEELVRTNAQSLAFKDLTFKEGSEQRGPFTLAYEVKGKLPGAEKSFAAVVLGDEDIFTNPLLYQNLNRDLALNAVSALAKEDNLISITPKEVQATTLNLTDTSFVVLIFALIIPLPVLFYILSGVQWFRRRSA